MEKLAPSSKIERVIAFIQQQIDDRVLVAGARLPSLRQLAQQLEVSISTVIEAYARLVTEQRIEARAGAGYFVTGVRASYAFTAIAPRLDREVDPLWISRQSLEANSIHLKPGCGWLPEHWMPEDLIRKALRTVSRSTTSHLVGYGQPLGFAELRHLIVQRMQMTGVMAHPDQILLTDSGTHAIDLVCRLFLNPNDVVLVDDPCYFNFHALLKTHQVKTISIPWTATGPDVEKFRAALVHKPRLYITNSGIHNPTGGQLSLATAYQILKMVEQTDLVIVEDDIFADLEYVPASRYAALNGFAQVIQIGSFSKTLSASMRCGYIATQQQWIEQLIDLKIATCFNNNQLNTEVIYHALTDNAYRKHVEWLKQQLALVMSKTIQNLQPLGISPWVIPQAGMFLWCRLPDGCNAKEISKICLSQGVILAPGNAFSTHQSAEQFLRFNVAQSADKRIYQALQRAMQQLT
ncbi:aminotransferase-like domain-containing protein [Acinetobacter sp. ANC 4641]|uniref:aminotransferase-like domain-containing protein n=1 Tax=Acinetobacter sp. ANC 4641 TaxID=2529847 RepID=UPI00103AD56F|nr:PLP-dependent aminotransferase family protein [Acinetobacter sp. ANC 4641]TCB11058.1 PLP-dependent aminotransferase family protein [Acinetobacter sp. ANC 4641]